MTTYATHDYDDGRISENAMIVAFDTREAAEAYLLAPYQKNCGWDIESAEIGAGRFGDCWIRVHSEPTVHNGKLRALSCDCAPFAADDLCIRSPGQHPGGRAWWIDPVHDVLVVAHIREAE